MKNTINGSLPYTDIPIDLVEEGLFGVDADRKNHMFEVFIQIHSRIKLNGEFLAAGRQRDRLPSGGAGESRIAARPAV